MTAAAKPRLGAAAHRVAKADPAERAQIIADHRAMLDWLEAHPDAPLSRFGYEIQFPADGPDDVAVTGLRLGLPVTSSTSAHRAAKRFGSCAYLLYAAAVSAVRS